MTTEKKANLHTLGTEMVQFTTSVGSFDTPEIVLDHLHRVVSKTSQLNVLGAVLFPPRWGDWTGIELGKTVFLHRSTPKGWWDEYVNLGRKYPMSGLMLARLSLASFTMSEMLRMVEPLGIERWSCDLAIKFGMRDLLMCPVGGRWVITYWSRQVLSQRLLEEERAILVMGATFAAIQLQRLLEPNIKHLGGWDGLTPRELSVLRLLSVGNQMAEVAALLELSLETVRTHLKKANAKLGVGNRTHAVAQALRQHMIP